MAMMSCSENKVLWCALVTLLRGTLALNESYQQVTFKCVERSSTCYAFTGERNGYDPTRALCAAHNYGIMRSASQDEVFLTLDTPLLSSLKDGIWAVDEREHPVVVRAVDVTTRPIEDRSAPDAAYAVCQYPGTDSEGLSEWTAWTEWSGECDGLSKNKYRTRRCDAVPLSEDVARRLWNNATVCAHGRSILEAVACCYRSADSLDTAVVRAPAGYEIPATSGNVTVFVRCTARLHSKGGEVPVSCAGELQVEFCKESPCGEPRSSLAAGERILTELQSVAIYRCPAGYQTDLGQTAQLVRCVGGKWTGVLSLCREVVDDSRWVRDEYSGSCYRAIHSPLTWKEAGMQCALAEASTEARTLFVELVIDAARAVAGFGGMNVSDDIDSCYYFLGTQTASTYKYEHFPNSTKEQCAAFSVCQKAIVPIDCTRPAYFVCSAESLSVEASWSAWGEWSACVAGGLRIRRRSCSNPNQQAYCGGRVCVGHSEEESSCCPDPPEVRHASKWKSSYNLNVGGRLTYACDPGYLTDDGFPNATLTCLPTGFFDRRLPICSPTTCPDPGPAAFSRRQDAAFPAAVDSILEYECLSGYTIYGTRNTRRWNLSCGNDGAWNNSLPICTDVGCVLRSLPESVSVVAFHRRPENGQKMCLFCFGDAVEIACTSAAREFAKGVTKWNLTCSADGRLSSSPPCLRRSCGAPPPAGPRVSVKSAGSYRAGEVLEYSCKDGAEDPGLSSALQLKCTDDGTWSGSPPRCREAVCPRPSFVGEGLYGWQPLRDEYHDGDYIQVVCDRGFGVDYGGEWLSSFKAYCTAESEWSSPVGCTRVNCGSPGQPAGGLQFGESYYYGDVVTFRCWPGYVLAATDNSTEVTLRCGEDGLWSGPVRPMCHRKVTIHYGLSYRFENVSTVAMTLIHHEDYDGLNVEFNFIFKGAYEDHQTAVEITGTMRSNRSGAASATFRVFPGLNYGVWVIGKTSHATEVRAEMPEVEFYAKTGEPALYRGFSLRDAAPLAVLRQINSSSKTSTLSLEISGYFSIENGEVQEFTLIVAEVNGRLPQGYYDGRLDVNLSTWYKARQGAVWQPYQAVGRCRIFHGDVDPGAGSGVCARDPPALARVSAIYPSKIEAGDVEAMLTRVPESFPTSPFTIGIDLSCDDNSKADEYCNGPLKMTSKYCVKLRAFTADSYVDTPCLLADEPEALSVLIEKASFLTFGIANIPFFALTAIALFVRATESRAAVGRTKTFGDASTAHAAKLIK